MARTRTAGTSDLTLLLGGEQLAPMQFEEERHHRAMRRRIGNDPDFTDREFPAQRRER
jgi:hypothetical protein